MPMERLPYRLVLYSESAMVGQFRTGYGYLWWGKRYSTAQAQHASTAQRPRSGRSASQCTRDRGAVIIGSSSLGTVARPEERLVVRC